MEIENFATVQDRYWPDLWPAASRPLLEKALEDARARGTGNFVAECPTARGKPKWWDVVVSAVPGSDRREKFVVISRDVTRQRQADAAERQYSERLRAILGASTDVLWEIDLETDAVWWSEGLNSLFGYGPEEVGYTTAWCHALIHPEDRARVVESMAAAVETGDAVWEEEFRYRKADGTYLDVHDRGTITRDPAGKAVRFAGIMQNITDRKAALARQDMLAKELAHRLNNTLAVVAGIFQQTRLTSTDLDGFAETFGRRIFAMANANSLLVRSRENSADLEELATLQLAPFRGGGRLSIDGPRVALASDVSQAMALALNELATNALKYGALTCPEGRVSLSWTVESTDAGRLLRMEWREQHGPLVHKPTKTGLGSKLIDHGIPDAKVERVFAPDGFVCSIALPLKA
jgi:PAS domain S-box-containing protein